jgi:sensor histidine kinase YesM
MDESAAPGDQSISSLVQGISSRGFCERASKTFLCMMKKVRWHILFWLLYFAGWTWFSVRQYHSPLGLALAVTGVWFVGQASMIYMVIYRLVPRYLKPKRGGLFVLYLVLAVSVASVFITGGSYALIKFPIDWRAYFGYTLLGNAYWAFLALAFTIIRDRLRTERRNQRLEKERVESELRFLKSQMNPHFLFNALNSIYVLIRKDPDLAEHSLAGFSEMLRYQLYECAADLIPIEKETAYLDNYIRLEELRKGNSFKLTYHKEGTHTFFIAPLLIMPLVENAFKYVSSFPDKENWVWINLTYREPVFTLEVRNTVGEEAGLHQGGIGQDNLRKRLGLLYPGLHRLEIREPAGIYSVTLTIQIQ